MHSDAFSGLCPWLKCGRGGGSPCGERTPGAGPHNATSSHGEDRSFTSPVCRSLSWGLPPRLPASSRRWTFCPQILGEGNCPWPPTSVGGFLGWGTLGCSFCCEAGVWPGVGGSDASARASGGPKTTSLPPAPWSRDPAPCGLCSCVFSNLSRSHFPGALLG